MIPVETEEGASVERNAEAMARDAPEPDAEVDLPVLTMPVVEAKKVVSKLREGKSVELEVSPTDESFIENLEDSIEDVDWAWEGENE